MHLHLGFWTHLHLETKVSGNPVRYSSSLPLRKLQSAVEN